ncbi:MAG TPA: DUF2254 family protein [Dermatophilaceae bacterium]|nr:DUF2254 family protein [Dermatophilaceae bacterium]
MIHGKRRAALPRGVVQAAYVVGGLAAGVLLGSVDLGPPLSPARVVQLLAGIAAGLLSLFGIVYSVLFFVVPFAATSQSPRLNLFRRHPLVWHSTAALAGSAVYCIAAGFAVASRDRASVGVAVVAVALVGAAFALIVALQGVAFRFVQLAPVLDQISSRGEAVLDELFPGHLDSTDGGAGGGADGTVATAPVDVETVTDGPDAAGGGTVVHWRERPRVLRRVDGAGLVEFLREADATAVLHVSPGARLRHGDRVLTVSGATALAQPPARLLRFLDAGLERSFEQDPAFAFRLLSDIGLRALSPAVNDHATAVAAIEESGSLLRVLVHRDLGSGRLCDSEGTVRLRHPSMTWPDFLRAGFGEFVEVASSTLVRDAVCAELDALAAMANPARAADVAAFRSGTPWADRPERLRPVPASDDNDGQQRG